jgi:hypothetical protein
VPGVKISDNIDKTIEKLTECTPFIKENVAEHERKFLTNMRLMPYRRIISSNLSL